MRTFEVTSLLTVLHRARVQAATPEEAEQTYEDEVLPGLVEDLANLNIDIEEASSVLAEQVDRVFEDETEIEESE